ncbi:MAG: DMT family transporter [Alicyclobacillus sp.]|nr:DMT family transporter [Alicyclobacillus sp.]
MHAEMSAFASVVAFGLAYLFVNRAQAAGDTSDNGLLPLLAVSTAALWTVWMGGLLRARGGLHLGAGWPRALLICALAGISWNFLSRLALLAAIVRIGATRGLVVKAIAPMLTVAIAVVWLGEDLHLGDWIGGGLMIASIALLVVERGQLTDRSAPPYTPYRGSGTLQRPSGRGGPRTGRDLSRRAPRPWSPVALGLLLGVAAALFQALGHLLRKFGTGAIPPLLGAAVDMTAATVAYLACLTWTGTLSRHVRFYLRHRSRFVLAASLLTAAGVVASFVSIAGAPVATVALVLGVQPAIMPVLSKVCFPGFEHFTWLSYVAAGMVTAGVACIAIWG